MFGGWLGVLFPSTLCFLPCYFLSSNILKQNTRSGSLSFGSKLLLHRIHQPYIEKTLVISSFFSKPLLEFTKACRDLSKNKLILEIIANDKVMDSFNCHIVFALCDHFLDIIYNITLHKF